MEQSGTISTRIRHSGIRSISQDRSYSPMVILLIKVNINKGSRLPQDLPSKQKIHCHDVMIGAYLYSL